MSVIETANGHGGIVLVVAGPNSSAMKEKEALQASQGGPAVQLH